MVYPIGMGFTIDDLAPNPENPRKISKAERQGLNASLAKFGDLSGITFNARTKQLVCGHQRLNELRALGGEIIGGSVWVGSREFKVRIVDWDKAFEREANIAANNKHIHGEWNDDIGEFLKGVKIGMSDEDFAELRFDALADELKIDFGPSLDDDSDDADVPDLPADPVTKDGDVWTLGDHALVCGDASHDGSYPKNVSLWLTDPPYNVAYIGKTQDALEIKNDNMTDGQFKSFLLSTFRPALSSMAPGASFYVWHAEFEGYNFRGSIIECGQAVRQCLIWKKNSMVLGRQDYHWQHEPCLYGWKAGGPHGWYSDRKQTTILEFDKPNRSDVHPTMKPLALFGYLIKNSSPPGALVLDNFCGSGTTLAACEKLGRKCHAIELDPKYCDVIIERWENMTGGKAVRK